MSELVFFRRGMELLRVGLERERLVIGSGEDSDIVLPDPHLSPRHVSLLHDGSRCLLEDLSGQGVPVAGKPMTHGELSDGVDLALGQWRAMFRERGPASTSSPTRGEPRTDLQHREALEEDLPSARVRIKQGDTVRFHELGQGSFTVGTSPDNALVIQDRFVSSRHLQVTRRGRCFHVQDLGSTNGTFLNNALLDEGDVPLDSVLRLGETELVFEVPPPPRQEHPFHGILGTTPAVQELVEIIQKMADMHDITVLLLGESGTGKELVAKAIHETSPRAAKAFIPINCAAIPAALIESELFGHEKGAFTGATARRQGAFEAAHGGTLFLDEVGELPLDLQARLLRALEHGEIKRVGSPQRLRVDVQVVAATNRHLPTEVREGRFRADLYYRLCVLPVVLPPLRARRADIPLLAEHFLREHTPEELTLRFTPAALTKLQVYSWPGNVRELRNVVRRALLDRKGPEIDATEISFKPRDHRAPEGVAMEEAPLELPEGVTLEQMLERLERQLIASTLIKCNGNRNAAARRLGMARSTLFKRLKTWGISAEEETQEEAEEAVPPL